MSLPGYVVGLPRVGTAVSAVHRIIFKQADPTPNFLALGKVISGADSRDPGNTGDLDVLRPGLLMGKITSTGEYAPALVGITTGAYTSGGTSLTVSAAQAVELARLVGQSGTAELVCVGPPTAAGVVAATAFDHSAIDTTTGIITVTSLGVDKIAGSFIAVNDGRYTPLAFIPDGYGHKVTDTDGTTNLDQPFPQLPIGGVVIAANILPTWPSDTSLRTWIVNSLRTYGVWAFDYGY